MAEMAAPAAAATSAMPRLVDENCWHTGAAAAAGGERRGRDDGCRGRRALRVFRQRQERLQGEEAADMRRDPDSQIPKLRCGSIAAMFEERNPDSASVRPG